MLRNQSRVGVGDHFPKTDLCLFVLNHSLCVPHQCPVNLPSCRVSRRPKFRKRFLADISWKEETQKAIQPYQEQIKPILERPATCKETDMSGAVERAELFLGEDTTIWVRPPENFLLLITDGLDTRNKTQIRLKTSPQVLVVNGTGSEGVLSEIPHKSFESNRAAFDYLKITIETGQAHE